MSRPERRTGGGQVTNSRASAAVRRQTAQEEVRQGPTEPWGEFYPRFERAVTDYERRDASEFRSVLGALMYLAHMVRPDVSYTYISITWRAIWCFSFFSGSGGKKPLEGAVTYLRLSCRRWEREAVEAATARTESVSGGGVRPRGSRAAWSAIVLADFASFWKYMTISCHQGDLPFRLHPFRQVSPRFVGD